MQALYNGKSQNNSAYKNIHWCNETSKVYVFLYPGKDQHFSFSQNSIKYVSEEKLLLTFYWPFDGWLLAIRQPFCLNCWPSFGWLLDNCCPTDSGPTVNDVPIKCVPYWKVSIIHNTCTLMWFLHTSPKTSHKLNSKVYPFEFC